MPENLLIQEYLEKKELYKNLGENVANIIRSILRELGINAIITHREKSVHKFKEKVKRKGYTDPSQCMDLSGVRIVFYLQSDLEKVHEYIEKNFVVDKINSGVKHGRTGYEAHHYVVSLKEDRIRLQEYNDLDGLKCEIQLTTILSHTWAEIEHDIIYKPDSLVVSKFPKEIQKIEKKFKLVMEKYIKEVEGEFETLKQDYQKLEDQIAS